MSDEDPPPIKKYTEFDTIDELRDSVIEDIKYYENSLPHENGEYMSNVMRLDVEFLKKYLKLKFGIDESEILRKGWEL